MPTRLLIKASAEPQQLLLLIARLINCASQFGLDSVAITEATGGKHKPGSLHYEGRAIDVRTAGIADKAGFLKALKAYYGPSYDVIDEGDHFHIEWDPK